MFKSNLKKSKLMKINNKIKSNRKKIFLWEKKDYNNREISFYKKKNKKENKNFKNIKKNNLLKKY